ncbi:MAG TPA: pentapeptide repeat-containing protein, partial [Ktedonobacterales bacterium]|nr:pentapeptide repeat-containing protein [Ktedonobacterales bacterium]
LIGAHLEGVTLSAAHLEGADLGFAHLQGADLREGHLEGAILRYAHLEGADLGFAHLQGAILGGTSLEMAILREGHYERATLSGATLDTKTRLNDASLDQATRLGDIQWGGVGAVNLTQVKWGAIGRLGDETRLERKADADEVEGAVRAYRQLAAQLRAQGLAEVADRFSERAQIVQRRVLRKRRRYGQWLFSWLLALLSGYGYRPARTVFWYLVFVLGFAALYLRFGIVDGHPFRPLEALVFSLTSFHGRGFFPGGLHLDDPVTVLAAGEAVLGLLIEISFIATFTQRFFGAK